jgi:hypothetical protein
VVGDGEASGRKCVFFWAAGMIVAHSMTITASRDNVVAGVMWSDGDCLPLSRGLMVT